MKRAIKFFARILLGVCFISAGVMHFVLTMGSAEFDLGNLHFGQDFYIRIMPDYIPAPEFMVYASGVTEVIAGIMLLVPSLSVWGAWFIVAHLVVFFTVHFWMIQHASDLYAEIPLWQLWLRIVIQVVFIVWALWFVTPDGGKQKPAAAA